MIFDFKMPSKDNTISFLVYDKDVLSPDDYISSVTVDFSKEAKIALSNEKRIKMFGP